MGFYRFGIVLARSAPEVIACWVIIAVVALLLMPHFEASLTGPPLNVDGSESARAQELIDQEFDQPFTEQDLIVFESETLTTEDPAFRGVVLEAIANVSRLPLVVT
ncbi:MAG: hypothetical protein M3457_22265, partial [Chloroflexota bacterium]|nr:hypothetical protein [Chloroflexota bacterium]